MYNPQNTDLDITKVHIYHDRGQRAQQLKWILTSPFALLKMFPGKIPT